METIIISIILVAVLIVGIVAVVKYNKNEDPKMTFLVDKEGNPKGIKLPGTVDNPNADKIFPKL